LSTTGKHKQFSVDDALYRHGQKPSEKGFLKRMAKRVFGPKDKHYDMPDLFEPLVCFNNAACKPIWPKIQPPAHIPNPRLLERRNEILRQARLNNQF
jgi:hypothetical protein